MKVVTRYRSEADYYDKLRALGIEVRLEDEDGNTIKAQEQVGACITTHLHCANGDYVRTIMLTPEQADKLPEVIEAPVFVVDWREDETETVVTEEGENEKLLDWPFYDVAKTDEDGNPDGTRRQGAPRIGEM